jgi:acyl carrier protein
MRDDDFARREEIGASVRRILIEELHVRREAFEIDLDAPLFGTGLALDSIDGIDLAVAIENGFGVVLPDGNAMGDILGSVNSIIDFVIDAQGKE